MLYGVKFAICSEINTKHRNTVWKNTKLFNVKYIGASLYQ
jgi:hypothetical protein